MARTSDSSIWAGCDSRWVIYHTRSGLLWLHCSLAVMHDARLPAPDSQLTEMHAGLLYMPFLMWMTTQSAMPLQMGLVSQEPTLFATTIGTNIAYGKPGATPAEIEAAAIAANAHSFISALPHGCVPSLFALSLLLLV